MKISIVKLALVFAFISAVGADADGGKIKVACVGDSITYGAGIDKRDINAYPAKLQTYLGAGYEVRNYGSSGCTMLKKGDVPYWAQELFNDALKSAPDIVIILLGTNDSKPQNWKFKDEFEANGTEMIRTFRDLPSKPRVIVCTPPPVFKAEQWGIRRAVVKDEIIPGVQRISTATGCEVVDLYTPLVGRSKWFPDTVHPNAAGADFLAMTLCQYLKSSAKPASGKGSTSP